MEDSDVSEIKLGIFSWPQLPVEVDKNISSKFSWQQGRVENVNGNKRVIISHKQLLFAKLKENFADAETYVV